MTTREIRHALLQLEYALARLEKAVQQASDDELRQDGVIQRFEFSFELLWKTLKLYLGFLGEVVNNPRDTLKAAFRQGLLFEETLFLNMLGDRNLSTHVYNFATTRVIYQKIAAQYLGAMQTVLTTVQQRIAHE